MDLLARALRAVTSQDVARGNAAAAADELTLRRLEHEDADAYLRARRLRNAWVTEAARRARPDSAP